MTKASENINQTQQPFPKLITRSQFAKMLNVSTRSVARWGEAGIIKAYRITPGTIRYLESDARRMFELEGK